MKLVRSINREEMVEVSYGDKVWNLQENRYMRIIDCSDETAVKLMRHDNGNPEPYDYFACFLLACK
jgi:hypothetical protein